MPKWEDVRNQEPPKGSLYCYTRWGGVVHMSDRSGENTLCGYPVVAVFSTSYALASGKGLCNGCHQERYHKQTKTVTDINTKLRVSSTYGKSNVE